MILIFGFSAAKFGVIEPKLYNIELAKFVRRQVIGVGTGLSWALGLVFIWAARIGWGRLIRAKFFLGANRRAQVWGWGWLGRLDFLQN